MSNRKNEIIINGKHYDALTGKLLATSPSTPVSSHPAKSGITMEGVVKPKNHGRSTANIHQQTAKHVHGKPERSNTLMRTAVKKPDPANKIHSKAMPAHQDSAQTKDSVQAKALASVPAERYARATGVQKSSLVSRFGNDHGPVKPITTIAGEIKVKKPPNQATESPAVPTSTRASNPFDTAVSHAKSHHQKPPKKTKLHHKAAHKLRVSPRTVSFSAFAMASVFIVGFVAFQNVPYVAMKVASNRSGVGAELPSYKPSGFKLSGPIRYSSGEIIVNYKSRTDNRAFEVKQRKSAWNSESLNQNFLASNQLKYQTYQDKGKTIYIYNGSSATWVNGGIWYQVEGDSSLSSEQLLRIANSL
ncbi:hypothetical protein BH23PAT1_BH23PAT1_0990 [soil metagenome]